MLLTGWTTPLQLLKDEIVQKEYEGYSVPLVIRESVDQLHPTFDAFNEEKITRIHSMLDSLQIDPSFNYVQPNELDGIRKLRPDGPRKLELPYGETELLDRLYGAWTGRCVGCALGKPVEGLGMSGANGLNGRLSIKQYLQNRNCWPLDNYFSGEDKGDITLSCPNSYRENIQFMEPDDDIHYTLIGLKVLEECGPDFCWSDVASMWNKSLPYAAICTAETQANSAASSGLPAQQ